MGTGESWVGCLSLINWCTYSTSTLCKQLCSQHLPPSPLTFQSQLYLLYPSTLLLDLFISSENHQDLMIPLTPSVSYIFCLLSSQHFARASWGIRIMQLELHSSGRRWHSRTPLPLNSFNNDKKTAHSLSWCQVHWLKGISSALLGLFGQDHISSSRKEWILGKR